MKKSFASIAIALSALAAAVSAQAANSTAVQDSLPAQVQTEQPEASVADNVQRGDQTYIPPTFSTLSRAEVNADTAAWRKAGLADEWRGNATPDIYSLEYRRKLAYYQHLIGQ